MTTYLPRTAWTTVPARGDAMPPRPLGVAVHWPGTTRPIGTQPQAAMAARLEGYRRYHVNGNGWLDIAYQVGIDQDGRVWDLRGIQRQSAANGDQTVNRTYLACLFLLGPGETPSPALLTAFADWRRDKALGRYPTATRVVGHRDIKPQGGTECPGPITEALIKAGRLTASPNPTSPAQEDEMPYTPEQIGQYAGTGVLGAQIGRTGLTVGVVLDRLYAGAARDRTQVAALTAAVQALAQARDGLDPAAVQASIDTAVKAALADVQITLTNKGA